VSSREWPGQVVKLVTQHCLQEREKHSSRQEQAAGSLLAQLAQAAVPLLLGARPALWNSLCSL